MKSLVIGGTGIIGNHVIRCLLAYGHEVVAFSRGVTPSLNLEGLDVRFIKGDLNDRLSIEKAMKGCDWVFHTAPYYPTHMFDLRGHLEKARLNTQTVLAAFKKSEASRLIYTSSLTTIGLPKNKSMFADEACYYNMAGHSPHPYFEIKHQMEEILQKEVSQNDLDIVIVNPTGCFGPYELKPKNLCLVVQLVLEKLPAYVDNPINVVDVADVAKGHVLAAQKGKKGERYILGGHNVSTGWVIHKICELAHVKAPRVKLPVGIALIPSFVSEFLSYYIFKNTPAIPSLGLRFSQFGQHLDISKSQRELGYRTSSMEPCFEKTIEWFKKVGYC